MSGRKAYYESFGCQMNAFDTEVIEAMMNGRGIMTTDSPEEADVIIVNTCSVRENAEQRAIGRLNDLSRHGEALLAVCGCMAQRMGDELFEKVNGLSLVAGPDNYTQLPDMVISLLEGGGRLSMTHSDDTVTYHLGDLPRRGVSRFLSITRGCENYCSYCIVPYLRGDLRSKDPLQVITEIGALQEKGAREVTLLGQNVMAYHHGEIDFVRLLKLILGETDIERVRFLTTHPRDVVEDIFELMRQDERICPHIHLPFQSGSDRILKMMNRGYTREKYLDIISRARSIREDIAFTTDIIVGFPSETEKDFEDTMDIVRRCRFDSAFTFKYSPRKGTAAYALEDDISVQEKKKRLELLNMSIQSIRRDILESRLGAMDEILLDARVKKGEYHYWKGRTPHFRNVLIEGEDMAAGNIIKVVLKKMRNFTYIGEEVARR